MFKRNLIKVYVLLWFITGCKISYKTYNFEDSPNIETPDYSKSDSWAVLPDNLPDEIAYLNKTEEKKNADAKPATLLTLRSIFESLPRIDCNTNTENKNNAPQ